MQLLLYLVYCNNQLFDANRLQQIISRTLVQCP
jgi:hypothetical protein